MRIPSLLTLCAGLVLRPSSLPAQAPGVPIESAAPLNQNRALLDKLAALRDTGRALDTAAIKAALQKPAPAAITLPPCRSTPLRPAEVWQESRVAFARFHIATGTKKETEAAAAAARLADESLKDNGPLLNETAWKLITRAASRAVLMRSSV